MSPTPAKLKEKMPGNQQKRSKVKKIFACNAYRHHRRTFSSRFFLRKVIIPKKICEKYQKNVSKLWIFSPNFQFFAPAAPIDTVVEYFDSGISCCLLPSGIRSHVFHSQWTFGNLSLSTQIFWVRHWLISQRCCWCKNF